jgi:hypothetical protein
MALTTDEEKEVVGILQQKEVDLRDEVRELDPSISGKIHGPRMVAKWTEELETKAARVRELWTKMERS